MTMWNKLVKSNLLICEFTFRGSETEVELSGFHDPDKPFTTIKVEPDREFVLRLNPEAMKDLQKILVKDFLTVVVKPLLEDQRNEYY